jgi:hypothetical protein
MRSFLARTVQEAGQSAALFRGLATGRWVRSAIAGGSRARTGSRGNVLMVSRSRIPAAQSSLGRGCLS